MKREKDILNKKKLPQIEWMIFHIQQLSTFNKNDPYYIVDVGGGRGDLSISLALRFQNANITVVDKNQVSLLAGKSVAESYQLNNIKFINEDVRNVSFDKINLVIGLHCCGGLTDEALNLALKYKSSFVICTCCFCSNNQLLNDHFYLCDEKKDQNYVDYPNLKTEN